MLISEVCGVAMTPCPDGVGGAAEHSGCADEHLLAGWGGTGWGWHGSELCGWAAVENLTQETLGRGRFCGCLTKARGPI